jgi:hypothetical protein
MNNSGRKELKAKGSLIMPRTISLVLVLALVLMVVAACVQSQPTAQPQGGAKAQPAQSQAQPIVLKAVTFCPAITR